MITLQFRDRQGVETHVTFYKGGLVKVSVTMLHRHIPCVTTYTKDSPIAAMYQQLLHNSREVGPNLYQVVGAW